MTTTVMAPTRRYRTIRGKGANYKTADYKTAENGAKAAQKWADHDNDPVLCLLWDESHPHDELNRGWALDSVVQPRLTVSLRIENRYADGTVIVTEANDVKVPRPPLNQGSEHDEERYSEWSHEHIFCHTGTGRPSGDSWYDVEITACTDPGLVGTTFAFGY
jgi:hypothetical protein